MIRPGGLLTQWTMIARARARAVELWLNRVDPRAHRRIKGLRLVTAYAIAAMLGTMGDISRGLPGNTSLATLAGGFALWASVSEGRGTRWGSTRDLLLLAVAAGLGAASLVLLSPLATLLGHHGPELILVSGAFCVGYLRRYGLTGAGIGSQIFIGQLLGYGAKLGFLDLTAIAVAVCIAAAASIVQRVLSGPGELPPSPAPTLPWRSGRVRPELAMGLQAATGALFIFLLNGAFNLVESAWAITACTYVIAGSAPATIRRVMRRVIGTLIGVPIGLAFLPIADVMPVVAWFAAALAMVIYAMALPARYDIACGAYAFTLIATLAVTGEHDVAVLAARAWETLLGGATGLLTATVLLPLQAEPDVLETSDHTRRGTPGPREL